MKNFSIAATLAEICDQVEVSVANVRTMLSRARKVVRDCMVNDWVDCKGRRRTQGERVDLVEARSWPSQRRLTPYSSTEID